MTGEEWLEEGDRFFQLEEFKKAVEAYEKVSEFHPQYATACYRKGRGLRKLERYQEALEAYDEVLKREPKNEQAWNYRGFALDELDEYEDALKAYERAAKLDSRYFEAWYNKAIALDKLGRHKKALKAYERAIRINPTDADAWFGKASVLDELGRYGKALEAYDQALDLDPENAGAWNNKGVTLHKLAKYKKAKQAFENAASIDPQDAVAIANVGDVLFRLLDFDGASKNVDDALAVDPHLADAWTLRGSIQIEEQHYSAAAESFRKAIPLDPDNPWLLLWFAYAEYLDAEFSLRSATGGVRETERGGGERQDESQTPEASTPPENVIQEAHDPTSARTDGQYQQKMLSIMRGLERAERLCERRGRAVAETRAHILYLLGCFYQKNRDVFGAKEKLQRCIKLKSTIRSPARDLLRTIWNFQIRPSWWQWWIASPSRPWGKRILFALLVLCIVGLFGLQPFIGEWIDPLKIDGPMYVFFIVLLLFLLLSPRIERLKAKDVELQLRSSAPFEFVLSPAMMEEIIAKLEQHPKE
jgi:tetratricopeptide (TPR) repeat protein